MPCLRQVVHHIGHAVAVLAAKCKTLDLHAAVDLAQHPLPNAKCARTRWEFGIAVISHDFKQGLDRVPNMPGIVLRRVHAEARGNAASLVSPAPSPCICVIA